MERLLHWFIAPTPAEDLTALWESLPRLSADEISAQANLARSWEQRETFQQENIQALAENWQRSVFYQTDLKDMAKRYAKAGLDLPAPLTDEAPLMTQINDAMFLSDVLSIESRGQAGQR